MSSVSCINKAYDLTKDIDTKVNVDGDISAPLGNSELMLADDFLDLNEGEGNLKTDTDGNYYLSVSGNGTSASVAIPLMRFDHALVSDGGYEAIVRKDELGLPSSGTVPSTVFTKHFKASSTPLDVDEDVPSEVIDIKDIEATGTVTVSLSSGAGKVILSSLVLDFPDYIRFAEVKDASMSLDHNGNVLRLGTRTLTPAVTELRLDILGIDFSRIPSGQGFIASRHKILINDEIKLQEFDLKAVISDFGSSVSAIPDRISADIGIKVSSLDVDNATVKVRPDISIEPVSVNVGSLPELVNGDAVVLDLYNPSIALNVDNSTPLELDVNADIVSYKGQSSAKVHFGGTGSDKVVVNAGGRTSLYISRTGEDAPAGTRPVTLPGIGDIIRNVPDRICIAGITADPADEYVVIRPGARYGVSYDYEVKAPLAFGKDVHLEYSTDFDGWNGTFNPKDNDFALDIRNAVMTFDFINMLPLKISLAAEAIDTEDNVIRGIEVKLDGSVAAGSLEKPSETALTLALHGGPEDMRRLDGIRLVIIGSDPGGLQGTCLNKNQGIQFRNMKIRVVGSMDIDL